MVIQRWQSVLLFLAAIFMVLLCVLPLGCVSDNGSPESLTCFKATNMLPLMIVGVMSAIMFVIAIFLFKNLNLQKRVTLAACILVVASIAILSITALWIGIIWPILALIAAIWAYMRISADQKLLSSYDRIR
ncbi:DUF4293 family protein [uncultured Muribaculum sp.]|uniref:DUF4293 family protein n=1 Tax=uncultured Muribaculum sp. TaxID=1918613 RepID=UPI00260C2DBF|nr:DUF4293 family protein [uncultured Muribaculum sp.]